MALFGSRPHDPTPGHQGVDQHVSDRVPELVDVVHSFHRHGGLLWTTYPPKTLPNRDDADGIERVREGFPQTQPLSWFFSGTTPSLQCQPVAHAPRFAWG